MYPAIAFRHPFYLSWEGTKARGQSPAHKQEKKYRPAITQLYSLMSRYASDGRGVGRMFMAEGSQVVREWKNGSFLLLKR
jgi:hypothetical protein